MEAKRTKKNLLRRTFSLLLSLVVAMVFTASFTTGVFAAGKTKTVWLKTKEVTKYDDETSTSTYKYDKNGLLSVENDNGEKTVIKRNKNGAPVSDKQYDGKKLTGTCKYKLNKKGYVVKETNYVGKSKTVDSVYTYSYWGNGKMKKMVIDEDGKETHTYRKNGVVSKVIVNSSAFKGTGVCDKHGNETKGSYSSPERDYSITHKLTYNKKGDLVKDVETTVSTPTEEDDDLGEYTTVKTTTIKYTYDKAGNITKKVETINDDGDKFVRTTTTQYKKFKVAKKYWKYLDFDNR